jgi:carbonic anhydrase
MSVIDEVLKANERYLADHHPHAFSPFPQKNLAVLTCMDTRLTLRALGLQDGDAHIIRNAGAIVTEDALRSLLVSHHLLATKEIMVIAHTDCGLTKATDEQLLTMMESKSGTPVFAPSRFHAFTNVEQNVRVQLKKLRAHPWIEADAIRGFVFDVGTGRLNEVHLEPAGDAHKRGI